MSACATFAKFRFDRTLCKEAGYAQIYVQGITIAYVSVESTENPAINLNIVSASSDVSMF